MRCRSAVSGYRLAKSYVISRPLSQSLPWAYSFTCSSSTSSSKCLRNSFSTASHSSPRRWPFSRADRCRRSTYDNTLSAALSISGRDRWKRSSFPRLS